MMMSTLSFFFFLPEFGITARLYNLETLKESFYNFGSTLWQFIFFYIHLSGALFCNSLVKN